MKIAIIATAFLQQYIHQCLKDIKLDYTIHLYTDCTTVGDLYQSLEDDYDGFMISGVVPKEAILKKCPNPRKPIMDFGTDIESYYKVFVGLMYRYQTLDFKEGYIDLMEWVENARPLHEYLADGTLHQLVESANERVLRLSLEEIMETEKKALQTHITLWNEGKISFSTTRMSGIVPALQQAGVNVQFVYPSSEVIRKTLFLLIKEIKIQQAHKNQPAVILITVGEEKDPLTLYALYNALVEINRRFTFGFEIERMESQIRIFTTNRRIQQLSKGQTSCQLSHELAQRIHYNGYIGYGIGRNINSAILNARKALQECNNNINHHSFLVDEDGRLIGPLLENMSLTITADIPEDIAEISRLSGLSTLTIQKILGVTGKESFTAPLDLAAQLGVTVRTANRFLSALTKSGFAVVAYQRQNSSKGRPERVYQLNFTLAQPPQEN